VFLLLLTFLLIFLLETPLLLFEFISLRLYLNLRNHFQAPLFLGLGLIFLGLVFLTLDLLGLSRILGLGRILGVNRIDLGI